MHLYQSVCLDMLHVVICMYQSGTLAITTYTCRFYLDRGGGGGARNYVQYRIVRVLSGDYILGGKHG